LKIATFNKLLMSSSGDAAIKTRPDLATNHALRRHDLGFVFVQELGGRSSARIDPALQRKLMGDVGLEPTKA
jgi:hypothetical protein